MDLKVYTIDELKTRLDDPVYNQSGIAPLSPLRVKSYLTNPRARKHDPVLFEMHHNGLLIAYRTLLPDTFFTSAGEPHQFAWLSGNYVKSEFRRQGLSTRLFQEVENHWEGRIMYTNYAPVSKAVYDKTGRFKLLFRREGTRFYLRSAAGELLGKRLSVPAILNLTDSLINKISEKRLQRFQASVQKQYPVEQIDNFDQELITLFTQIQKDSLFRRDSTIFRWIIDHPWVASKPTEQVPYHFSYKTGYFENRLMKYVDSDKDITGFAWLLLHNRKMSVPYLFSGDDSFYNLVARDVLLSMIQHGSAYITIRHPSFLVAMQKLRKWFLSARDMPQLIFVHKKIAGLVPDSGTIHDGDGDVVFTG